MKPRSIVTTLLGVTLAACLMATPAESSVHAKAVPAKPINAPLIAKPNCFWPWNKDSCDAYDMYKNADSSIWSQKAETSIAAMFAILQPRRAQMQRFGNVNLQTVLSLALLNGPKTECGKQIRSFADWMNHDRYESGMNSAYLGAWSQTILRYAGNVGAPPSLPYVEKAAANALKGKLGAATANLAAGNLVRFIPLPNAYEVTLDAALKIGEVAKEQNLIVENSSGMRFVCHI